MLSHGTLKLRRLPRRLVGEPANDVPREAPRDTQIDRALAAMNADPRRRWTVAELARIAGLSRAAFARRFAKACGVGPVQHLIERRLQLAADQLLTSDASLAEIADAVGYATEFAFSKAFKRRFGLAPGRFRQMPARAETRLMARAAA